MFVSVPMFAKAGRACLVAGLAATFLALGASSLNAEVRAAQRKVPPIYPSTAKALHVEGTVKVTVTISPDGSVTKAEAKSSNRLLGAAAEDALKKWKFATASSETTQDIEIVFKLD